MKKLEKKQIVVIGGGTGTFTVLSSLKSFRDLALTAVVTMTDDGGSTGVLRDELGVLPPGDVRRSLVALSESDKIVRKLFNYRFHSGKLNGHSFGNLLLAALQDLLGGFDKAVDAASRILRVHGTVIPVTLDNVKLYAHLEDGELIAGETNIDIPKHDGSKRIHDVFIEPRARANKKTLRAIAQADLIVIGPGDLYTSIIPNFLVSGVSAALARSKAKKVYVANVMTKFGETNNFTVQDFVQTLERYIGGDVLDYVLYNTSLPSPQRRARYEGVKSECVKYEKNTIVSKNIRYIGMPLITRTGFIRHDPKRLASAIRAL